MRTLLISLLFATTLAAQSFKGITVREVDATGGLATAIARLPESSWVAWTAPSSGHSISCDRCTLDGSHGNFTISDDETPFLSKILLVGRKQDGRLGRVHFFNANCPIEGRGETVYVMTNVRPEDSISVLRENHEIAAIALHEHPSVVPLLIDLARHDPATKTRREALFWLGQKAGEKAAAELRNAVDNDPDEDVKEHAVFAISQLPADRSVPMLIDLVKNHKSRAVRKRAMFWLAQSNDPRALELIEEILQK